MPVQEASSGLLLLRLHHTVPPLATLFLFPSPSWWAAAAHLLECQVSASTSPRHKNSHKPFSSYFFANQFLVIAAVCYLQWSDSQNFQLHQALQSSETERAQLYSRINNLQEDYKVTIECLSVLEGKTYVEETGDLMLTDLGLRQSRKMKSYRFPKINKYMTLRTNLLFWA